MNILSKITIALLLILYPVAINASENNLSEDFQTDIYVAKVIEVIKETNYDSSTVQELKIELISEEYAGETAIINNTLTGTDNDIKLSSGDKINVLLSEVNGENEFYFHSYEKSNYLILLIIIFILFVIILGRLKGLKALLSLTITILLIIFGLIPLLLKGYNPVLLSIITCIISTILTFLITNGFTKKTLIAIIGVIGGLLSAGLIAIIFSSLMRLTGVAGESEQMLFYLPGDIVFDFKGILFAGILIGSLGALMDVAIELTSSMIEITTHSPKITDKKLIKSGLNIGKDIMGTMVNTLILAYTGSSLTSLLLYVGFEKSLSEIINLESITTEILRAISGSIGLLVTIPVTIFIFILLRRKEEKC